MSFGLPASPEFVLDRCLGKGVARILRDAGWRVRTIGEIYGDDAQLVDDEQWIRDASKLGLGMLTKDKAIRFRAEERAEVDGMMFCLAAGNLKREIAGERFVHAEAAIAARMLHGDPGVWMVYEGGRIDKKWPPA